ncbi:MAG: lipopolysaccharide kinase InaA family protein [Gemmatimonadaceae bacterium]
MSPEYLSFTTRSAHAVALADLADSVRAALSTGTLYQYAMRHPEARALAGRGIAYAVPLPGTVARVVVRRSRHGGLFAGVTGELFLPPTRAPHELATAIRLARAAVPTPRVAAYATYRAGAMGLLRRSDVATCEIDGARDLAAALIAASTGRERTALWEATARLVAALTRAGARHPDLNLRNVLITSDMQAVAIDVDRVTFGRAGDPAITRANIRRLARSARRWRERRGAAIDEPDIERLCAIASESEP